MRWGVKTHPCPDPNLDPTLTLTPLAISPYISPAAASRLHLPISPYISLHLPYISLIPRALRIAQAYWRCLHPAASEGAPGEAHAAAHAAQQWHSVGDQVGAQVGESALQAAAVVYQRITLAAALLLLRLALGLGLGVGLW